MTDYLLAFFGFFSSNENQWLFLFLSAFLSATVLPGNSEIVFSALATKSIYAHESFWHAELWLLVLVATVGNSLGSIVTYAMGMLAPKPINSQKRLGVREKLKIWRICPATELVDICRRYFMCYCRLVAFSCCGKCRFYYYWQILPLFNFIS